MQPNVLVLTLQPNEGVSLSLGAKIPGTRMRIGPVQMEFLYGTSFMSQSPEAYERLILDAMRGEAMLFTRNDEVEEQWRICDPIVSAWEAAPRSAAAVRGGLAGAGEADAILLGDHALADDLVPPDDHRERLGGRRHDRPRRSSTRCASCSSSGTPPTPRRRRHGS